LNYPLYVDSRGEYTVTGTGIMAEIRNLLSQGKSSSEVIALGYKPPTVYKVQRQLNKSGKDNIKALNLGNDPAPLAAPAHLQAENAELQQRIAMLKAELTEAASLRSELDQALSRIEELEAEVHQVKALRAPVRSFQLEVQTWQRKAETRQKALEEAEHHVSEAHRVVDALTPLNVWAGHPCCVCGRPTDGVVDKETAAKLLERTGHKECLLRAGLRRRRHSFDLIGDVRPGGLPSWPTCPSTLKG
jgi:DNA repair exonuclease SbcCD ATPase subunit